MSDYILCFTHTSFSAFNLKKCFNVNKFIVYLRKLRRNLVVMKNEYKPCTEFIPKQEFLFNCKIHGLSNCYSFEIFHSMTQNW